MAIRDDDVWKRATADPLAAFRLRRGLRSLIGSGARFKSSARLDQYVTGLPSAQNALDAVPGWVCAMPPSTGLSAGCMPLYADDRISWLLERCVDVSGRRVLELGPLEGSHTYMLHQAGAASIDAIEANRQAFLRCLVTKEVLDLSRARFLLGDFTSWLEAVDTRYDLVVASGVLYHSSDPVRLLELIGRRAAAVYLWTHYFDDAAMPAGDSRRGSFSGAVETRECNGVTLRVHERSYCKAWRNPKFCGGTQDQHFWLERDGILALLAASGFQRFEIADDQPDHVNGPSLSIFAST